MDFGFQVLDSGIQWNLDLRIPQSLVRLRILKPRILHSTSKYFPDSAIFFPCMGRCNLGSISTFLKCSSAAEHTLQLTLQRNMTENSRRALKTNTKESAFLQEKSLKL